MKKQYRSGFTLVELLVALSILVMVAGVLVATVSGGIHAWQRIQCKGGQNERILVAFQDMRRHLQNFRGFGPIKFKGKYDELYFPSLVSVRTKEGNERWELGRVGYYINESKKFLCRTEYSYREAGKNRYTESCTPIAEEVEHLKFQYYVYKSDEKSFSWTSSWESEKPPYLVKIELTCYDKCSEESAKNSFTVFVPQAAFRQ